MESFSGILQPLFFAYGFHEVSSTVLGSSTSLLYESNATGGNIYAINLRVLEIPSSREVIVYVKADQLLQKILTLKIQIPSSSHKLRGILYRGLILNMFPPLTLAPALAHVPEGIIHSICSFLPIKEVVALSCTSCRVQGIIRNGCSLWELLLHRDFPVLKTSEASGNVNRYGAYRTNFIIKVAHQRQARFRHDRHPFHFLTTLAPLTPSPIADFFFEDDWSGVPRPLSLQPPIDYLPAPPQRLSNLRVPFPPLHRDADLLPLHVGTELSPVHESYFQHRDIWF